MERAWEVGADLEVVLFLRIWAFCLITSAGVRIVQEIASARAEAVLWIKGVGSWAEGGRRVVFRLWSRDLEAS